MRGSVFGSALAHLLVVALLFAVRNVSPTIVPGPDVVQVALVDLTAPSTPPAPQPARPAPARKPLEIKPEEATGVKLVQPAPPTRKTPPSEVPPAVTTLPLETIGRTGLQGSMAVDVRDFEFTYYLLLVRNRVAQNWSPPAGMVPGPQPLQAVVYFHIGRGGDLSAVRLERASGMEFFDRSAVRAVLLSDPLPPLPLGYPGGDLGVHFGFAWVGP